MSAAIEVSRLAVALSGRPILRELDLAVPAGGYGVVLGRSGSGKSTLLRAIAGLVPATGTIRLGATTVCGGTQVVPPEDRDVGFLFQGLALWSHMSVDAHLRYALDGRRVPRREQAVRMDAVLAPLGLSGLRNRRPAELSGGERQRLALARAVVVRPSVLLLDEPTSSVDPSIARDVRELLRRVHRDLGTTILHVTHDQDEALELADTLVVVDDGRVLEAGPPERLFECPKDLGVARFLGAGTLVPGVVVSAGRAETPLGPVAIHDGPERGAVWLLARPSSLAFVLEGAGVPGVVRNSAYRGGGFLTEVLVGELVVEVRSAERLAAGAAVRVAVQVPVPVVTARSSA